MILHETEKILNSETHLAQTVSNKKMWICTNLIIIIISEMGHTVHTTLQVEFFHSVTYQGHLSTSVHCVL